MFFLLLFVYESSRMFYLSLFWNPFNSHLLVSGYIFFLNAHPEPELFFETSSSFLSLELSYLFFLITWNCFYSLLLFSYLLFSSFNFLGYC